MSNPEHIFVNIRGIDVSIKELQKDVAVVERTEQYDAYAFTRHTVQALIDKVIELDKALRSSVSIIETNKE